jgi:periplasmic protein TonB
MFETTVVESKKRKMGKSAMITLPISVGLHAIAIGAAVFAAVWEVSFPVNAPAQVAQYSAVATPPPPPPPPPPPAARPAQQAEPTRPVEIPRNVENLAPNVVPEQVPVLQVASSSDEGVEGGVEGGVPGGVVGGVIGGVVGGVITDTTPKDDAPLRVGGDVKPPVIVTRVDPSYPEVARKARVQGIVIVEAVIDRNGAVRDVKVLKGLPFGLSESASDAVRRWRFKPGTLNGKPVDVIFNLTVIFKLN